MASGYEKSRDYGGPRPTAWGIVAATVILAAITFAIWWVRYRLFT